MSEPCSNRIICTRCGDPIDEGRVHWDSDTGDPMHKDCYVALLNLRETQQYGVGQPENYDGSPRD